MLGFLYAPTGVNGAAAGPANTATRRAWPARIALALVLIVLGGCQSRTPRWLVFDKGPATEALAVDVDAFRGPVTIVADPEATNITIRARLRSESETQALSASMFEKEREQSVLHLIDVVADLTTDENGVGVLRVTTTTDYQRPDKQWVQLRITAPSVDGVRVRNRDGTVDLINVRGAITVVNEAGKVVVRTLEPIAGPVNIIAANGSIDYRVRAESEGSYHLESTNGKTHFKALYGDVRLRQRGATEIDAQVGEGTNPVILRSINGNTRVCITDDPVPIGFLAYKDDSRLLSK